MAHGPWPIDIEPGIVDEAKFLESQAWQDLKVSTEKSTASVGFYRIRFLAIVNYDHITTYNNDMI